MHEFILKHENCYTLLQVLSQYLKVFSRSYSCDIIQLMTLIVLLYHIFYMLLLPLK